MSSKEIARMLSISPRTVDLRVSRGMRRLSARTRAEAAATAVRQEAVP